MKNLLVLLFLLGNLHQVVAQDPQLFENDWFLQKVIINDEDIFPPSESVIGELDFSSEFIEVIHPNCEEGLGGSIEYVSIDLFQLSDAGVVLLGTCSQPETLMFLDEHYSIYITEENDGTAKNPFNYTFEQDGSLITLTVTNGEGDQGVYTNVLLNVEERELNAIAFYPNPTQNTITINSSEFLENVSIVMYDVTGKNILTKSTMSFDTFTLDIASFKSGVYFLELSTAAGTKRTEKIAKL